MRLLLLFLLLLFLLKALASLLEELLHFPRLQIAVAHGLHNVGGFFAAEQPFHIGLTCAKAGETHTYALAIALGALSELVHVLDALAVEGAPFASATAELARNDARASTLRADAA